MRSKQLNRNRILLLFCTICVAYTNYALAATEKVLLAFPNSNNGNRTPQGELVFDPAGNLYGGAGAGLTSGGVVYELTPSGNSWDENVIADPMLEWIGPSAGLVLDPKGHLFGTTNAMGSKPFPDGLVFELTPSSNGWTPSVVYAFPNSNYGQWPNSLIEDASGNLFGTAYYGGGFTQICGNSGFVLGCGTVFELSPKSGGGWKFTLLHSFQGQNDGGNPAGGHLILDQQSNLYGAAQVGGSDHSCNCGEIFQISSAGAFTILHSFHGADGAGPNNGLVQDSSGVIYGSAGAGGTSGYGLIFRLAHQANGTWREQVLYQFSGPDGRGPNGDMVFDASGNLWGTTFNGGAFGHGTVFELSPQSNGTWTESVVYSFTGGTDGAAPTGSVIFDSNGNLYGVTGGGGDGYGVV